MSILAARKMRPHFRPRNERYPHAGSVGWWDASHRQSAAGTTFNDRSGNNRTINQSGNVQCGAKAQNGRTVLDANGGYYGGTSFWNNYPSMTFFIVAQIRSATGFGSAIGGLMDENTGTAEQGFRVANNAGNLDVMGYCNSGSFTYTHRYRRWFMISCIKNGSAGSLYVDGVFVGSFTFSYSVGVGVTFRIIACAYGFEFRNSGDSMWAEGVCYGRAMDKPEFVAVNRAVMDKWAINQ